MNKLTLRKITALGSLALLSIVTIFLKPLGFLKKKPIWLFIDRPFGIDNAYGLYRYYKKQGSSNIEYRYLCENSADAEFKNLETDDGVVITYSLQHFRTFIHSDVLLYAYDTAPFYFNSVGKYAKKVLKPMTTLIFLSHGVTRGYLTTIAASNTAYDMFCSVGAREKKILKNSLAQENVQITGYPRFDTLLTNSIKGNTIVFLPAWRLDLSFGSESSFKESLYFERIQSFLQSKDLHNILQEYKTTLIWHPHQYIEPFIHLFDTGGERVVVNIGKEKKPISILLQEMGLFVTDNSGAQFDAAYIKKPLIHYDFYPYHIDDMREGTKEYFGEIVSEEDELITLIREYLESGMTMKDIYKKRVDSFFSYIDTENCKRTDQAIQRLVDKV